MNIKPLYDRVIVQRSDAETTTSAGIIIPDSAKEKPQQGQIMAVGSGTRKEDGTIIPLEVKVGDKVLFGKYAGTEIKIDDEEYLMMKEDDIMGIVQ